MMFNDDLFYFSYQQCFGSSQDFSAGRSDVWLLGGKPAILLIKYSHIYLYRIYLYRIYLYRIARNYGEGLNLAILVIWQILGKTPILNLAIIAFC